MRDPRELTSKQQITKIGVPDKRYGIDYKKYLKQENNGTLSEQNFPIVENLEDFYIGEFHGEKMLVECTKEDLYVVTDVRNIGSALVHYVYNDVNSKEEGGLHLSLNLPTQKLYNYYQGGLINMANLAELMSNKAQQNGVSLTPMNLSGDTPNMMTASQPVQNTGIGTVAHTADISAAAKANGYVYGYIVQTAPQITMKLITHKKGKTVTGYSLGARESKPSTIVRVLMALPKSVCAGPDGTLLRPEEIANGTNPINKENSDTFKVAFSKETAMHYILACGGSLPEYAPTHAGLGKHWTPSEIFGGASNVSFVTARFRTNNKTKEGARANMIYSLKSTRSSTIFTQENYLPLKIAKTIPIDCNSEQDEYEVNKSAFATFSRKVANQDKSPHDKALAECPNVYFERNFSFERVSPDGTSDIIDEMIPCSAYFLKDQEYQANGKVITKTDLTYVPWYVVSGKKDTRETKRVKAITRKFKHIATKSQNVVYSSEYCRYTDMSGDEAKAKAEAEKVYKPYGKFTAGMRDFISDEDIKSLNTRKAKSEKKMTDEERSLILADMVASESLRDEFASFVDKYAKSSYMSGK